jgi:GTP cyclohydrolase III
MINILLILISIYKLWLVLNKKPKETLLNKSVQAKLYWVLTHPETD